MNNSNIVKQQSDFILYTSNEGNVDVEVVLKDETVWLNQKIMAKLFGVKVPAISKHLANIFETGELKKDSIISILETVQKEGDREVHRKMEFYNLDAIIAVRYRVNSYQAIQFRTLQKLRDTLLLKLLSGKVCITEVLSLQEKVE